MISYKVSRTDLIEIQLVELEASFESKLKDTQKPFCKTVKLKLQCFLPKFCF